MKSRGTVNGLPAVIDTTAKTFTQITGNMQVFETMEGEMGVVPGRGDPTPKILPLLPGDQVAIERPLGFNEPNRWTER